MSISSTIRTMRKNEILSDISKMSVSDLMARRTELRDVLRTNPSESQLSKQEITDITMSISRELTNRAQAEDEKNGDTSAQQSESAIKSAQASRKLAIEAQAQRKLDIIRQQFDAMSPTEQFSYVEDNGKSPHAQEAYDFVSAEDKSRYFSAE